MNILIIDSHNMLHRARFGFGRGEHKIFFNFFRMLFSEIKKNDPDLVYIVDEGAPKTSVDLLPDYKGNREPLKDDDFRREKREIFNVIKSHTGFVYAKHPDFECDDVIGYLAANLHKNDNVTIISSDSDFTQLVSDKTTLWNPVKKKSIKQTKYDYVTWKALVGDATDNVPGVPGIGPKRAEKLIAENSIDAFLDKDPEKRKAFDVAYQVIKLKDVPSDEIIYVQSSFNEKALKEEFSNRHIKSMIGKAWEGHAKRLRKTGEVIYYGNESAAFTRTA